MVAEEKEKISTIESIEKGWYILCCQVGKELEIKERLEQKINNTPNIKEKIFEVLVPEEEEIQIKKGEKIRVKKAVYKGYIYIHMVITPETYSFVRSIVGVKGFLGGARPQKLSEKEVENLKKLADKLKSETPKIVRKFEVGDTVRIIDGPFKHFVGVVDEINEEKGKVKVSIKLFGRPTSMELEFVQVEKA